MNRFRFRAWDKENKWMWFDIQDVYDSECSHTPQGKCARCYPEARAFSEFLDAPERYVIMQSTGLLDKNGVEIFEGDVVKSMWQHDGVNNYDYEVIAEIKWSAEDFAWHMEFDNRSRNTTYSYPLHSFDREELIEDTLEIIGNVHENPELLEAK